MMEPIDKGTVVRHSKLPDNGFSHTTLNTVVVEAMPMFEALLRDVKRGEEFDVLRVQQAITVKAMDGDEVVNGPYVIRLTVEMYKPETSPVDAVLN